MNQLDLSVVVCTYNRAKALGEMLESLATQRRIEDLRYEVLVVGDGCTDDTADVVDGFRSSMPIRFVNVPHGGKSAALNRGCREARGELIVFLDDDVVVEERWLRALWDASVRRTDMVPVRLRARIALSVSCAGAIVG